MFLYQSILIYSSVFMVLCKKNIKIPAFIIRSGITHLTKKAYQFKYSKDTTEIQTNTPFQHSADTLNLNSELNTIHTIFLRYLSVVLIKTRRQRFECEKCTNIEHEHQTRHNTTPTATIQYIHKVIQPNSDTKEKK